MSPESLLLNALRCHLVFAGSLQEQEGGEESSGGPWRSRALALLCSTIFSLFLFCLPATEAIERRLHVQHPKSLEGIADWE